MFIGRFNVMHSFLMADQTTLSRRKYWTQIARPHHFLNASHSSAAMKTGRWS